MFKKPTVQRAAIRSTVPGLLAILIGLISVGMARADEPVIRMAGTFNNWSTNNDDYRLTKVDDHYELVRFWPCGKYEFKFVFDGSWSKHLGMGDDGKLRQPGRDIELCVKQSGEYRITLNENEKSWTSANQPPSRPKAIIKLGTGVVHGMVVGDSTYNLSCSVSAHAVHSLVRPGFPIKSYHWKIRDLADSAFSKEIHGLPSRSFTLPKRSVYEIELTIDDGEYKDTTSVRRELGLLYWLAVSTENEPKKIVSSHLLEEFGDGSWGISFSSKDLHPRIAVCKWPGVAPMNLIVEKQFALEKMNYFIRFDPIRNAIELLPESAVHPFIYCKQPEGENSLPPETIELVGDFNGWKRGANVMEFCRPFYFPLPDGIYHYKYIVNGCTWEEDPGGSLKRAVPDARYRQPDGKGGFNSGFRIGVDPATLGAAKADDVNEKAVKHDPADASYFARIGHDLMTLRVRTLAGDAKGVSTQFLNTDGAVQGEPIELSKAGTRDGFEYWSAVCSPANGAARYTFLIEDGKEHCILDADGAHSFAANEKIALLPRPFEPDTRMSFETPDWAKRAVWYQIFPERFRNGDPSNDPPTTVPWKHEWYKPYKGRSEGTKAQRHKGTEGRTYTESGDFWDFIFDRRYGGDIQGVKEKLPYLRKLGVTAIYFNPMFLAESMHKYDASDYRHIDDYFGVKDSLKKIKGETTDPATWQWSETDKIFLDFVKEAHRQGFKVVLDGVFNHVGRDFWAFKDVMKNGEKSEYVGWFEISSFKPLHYKAWDKDDGSLPRLRHDEALGLATPVREHLFAVTRRWMDPNGDGDHSDGIDGWRLDVAADVNANFWRDWRKLVKSINPEAYIVAEIWEESKSWLDGQTFDAVMNYPFARAAQRFFVNQKKASKPSEFQAELQRNLDWYAPQVNYVLQNLYCSHDTDRVASMFMNPDLEYDKENRQQDNGPNYVVKRPTSECYHKLRAMVAFQMTFLGAPMIYYGDEVGLYGADDPSDRKPMYWEDLMPYDDPDERIEPGLFEYHQRLIAIRNTFPALQLGSFEPLIARDDHGVFAFCRSLGSERVVVVFNNSDKPHRLDLPSPWPEDTHVDRADDPKAYELVEAKDAASRAVVRSTGKHKPSLKVENGRLHGSMIEPRTAAIFVKS